VAIAVIGLVATVVVPSIQEGPNAAKKAKLVQDVAIVNNAIDAYLVAGGAQGALTAGTVIEALKQRVLGGPTAEMTGPLGPFLDPRVVTNATDFAWSARFESSPRPRFVVQKSSNGVVFGRGLPSVVGGPVASAPPSWLWSAAPSSPGQMDRVIFDPGTTTDGTTLGVSGPVVTGLAAPVIAPAGGTLNLRSFPLQVGISNPNPTGRSIVYYRIDNGSYVLWVGAPFTVNPGSTVSAVAVSVDPSRYFNSSAVSETYQVSPLQLAVAVSAPGGVTYAQAGGQIVGQALQAPVAAGITIANLADIPPPYQSSSYFTVRYTLDGSDPLSSAAALVGPTFNGAFAPIRVALPLGAWGNSSSVTVRAVAVSSKSDWFTTSAVSEGTSTRAVTALTLNVIPLNPVGLPPLVQINESGAVPVGMRKFFTTDGSSPLTATSGGLPTAGASLYSAPIAGGALPSATYTLRAQAAGPAGFEGWFSSAPVTRTYRTVTFLPSEFVGANISGGDVNGSFRGSIFVSAPAELGIFNAGGQITGGNLYVPGLPGIEIPGSGNSTKVVAVRGRSYAESGEIPRSLIAGKEYSADGQLADQQLDLRQVVDLNGATTPTNYTVKLTKSAYIEGKIYRRADPPTAPAIPTVPAGLSRNTNIISGLFTNAISPGIYSNTITLNNDNSVLRLGVPGSASQYIFVGNTWTKGRVEVLGEVEIFFLNGFNNKGVTFGDANNVATNSAAPLRINVMTNSVDITGGGAVYAALWAANSAVVVGNASFFYGSMYARTLNVAPGGTVDVE